FFCMIRAPTLVSSLSLHDALPIFLVAVLVPRVVPADPPRAHTGPGARRPDLRGLAIAAPAVCLIVLPLVLGRELGWPAWTFGCVDRKSTRLNSSHRTTSYAVFCLK